MEDKYIYIIFSATPYAIGKMIRKITGDTYNHVSIALDRELHHMYGFARRYYRLPLLGGFVKECPSRYRVGNTATRISICKLPVTAAQHEDLCRQFSSMYENRHQYLYNHLSVLTAPLLKRVRLRNAYTCVEFAVQILQQLGHLSSAQSYYSLGNLQAALQAYCIYTGPLPDSPSYDADFFSAAPVAYPFLSTAKAFFALFGRIK